MPVNIEHLFEERAIDGDGAFAIALAVLRLAAAQDRLAGEISELGLGGAASETGAIGHLTLHLAHTGSAIAAAIQALADRE